jgi:hypothetical protein
MHRQQFWRLAKSGLFSSAELKALLPRCAKCVTQALKTARSQHGHFEYVEYEPDSDVTRDVRDTPLKRGDAFHESQL